jgi:hypothetical protein
LNGGAGILTERFYNVRSFITEQHLHGGHQLSMRLSAMVMLLCCVLSAPAPAAEDQHANAAAD